MIRCGNGAIQAEISLTKPTIEANIYTTKRTLEAEFKGLPTGYSVYHGAYEVIPKFYLQTLDTNGKLMSDDVDVLPIPVSYTSNLSGGTTALIG